MISVVVPAYNEAEAIPRLHRRLTDCARTWDGDYEIIVVDDGSRDSTLDICMNIAARDERFKIISFSRNFGHQAAVTAGLCYASGDYVAVMDADLQDPPEELLRLIDKARDGYDVVYAIRTKRKEGPLKRFSYWLYYRLLAALATVDIPLDSGDFCVIGRKALEAINALPERNRFVRGLRTWIGYRQVGVPYERQAREIGGPKYSTGKLLNLAFDGLINFSYKPLRLLMVTGACLAAASAAAGLVFLFQYVTDTTILGYNPRQARGWTSLILSILMLGGFQLTAMGILGEYIGRLYEESKGRPIYLVDRQVNFDHDVMLHPGMQSHPNRSLRTARPDREH